ncbi:MarR family winged helix-turn-helix transcriptional regulator [Caproiciproducens sp. MSJ-32]|uniref:MarR family winged helix-turn-helix transcriptional regulator n=1 Tax=Caproiciproducens sp. MSJ-32 TaxID=2841527 RepID=UPI001C0F5EFC|nr:MarR family transcriptional regulator [Caproiciproducens sp. MSJ-32]MBU5454063.1 MarR family transcriptional regulator [Caproiciproducens sp. MSJ-32]
MQRKEDVANQLLVKIFNNILEIEEKMLRKGEFSDLSIREMHIIESVGKKEQSMMSEVAQDLGITVGTLTTAINKLIKKGYVTRKRIEEDRRVVMVQLTEKGYAACENHKKFHKEMISSMMDEHTEEEKEILTHSLEKLNNYFNEKYKLVKK